MEVLLRVNRWNIRQRGGAEMCGDDGGDGIEVIFRIDGSDDEITHAVVIDELEQRFTREADESLLQFQMRVRAAAVGRSICWNGLPNPPWDSDWEQ